MRIAVTGGSGFIGGCVVNALVCADHEVVVVDLVSPVPAIGSEYAHADVKDLGSLQQAFNGAQVVYHLAGVVLEGIRNDPYGGCLTNMLGTLNTLEACKRSGIKRFLLASTFYVYGGLPTHEGVDESTHLNPFGMGLFGFSKLAGEVLAWEYAQHHGIQPTILRFGSTFGPGKASNVVNTFLEAAMAAERVEVWGNGSRKNQYTYVGDVAKGCLLALDYPGHTFNLISPEVTTTGELAGLIGKMLPFQVDFNASKREGDGFPYMSSDKARKAFGWTPLQLEDALASMVRKDVNPGM